MKGVVTGEIIDVRFAFAGKVARVSKIPGDIVKIGDFLASLDRKELQSILDKELADYEKVRAEFEIFVINNPNPADEKTKYEKVQAQALLNASVKAVELAKINLDAADLKSPVNGIVVENSGLRAGMNITPGSYSYRILDTDSLVIETEENLNPGQKVSIGTVLPMIPAVKGKAVIRIKPEKTEDLVIGEEVEISI
jgi:multidrug resistance efflux pump